MLLPGIDHHDRFGLSTHGRHGEELGRARHAANAADSTLQGYSKASSQPSSKHDGQHTDLLGQLNRPGFGGLCSERCFRPDTPG